MPEGRFVPLRNALVASAARRLHLGVLGGATLGAVGTALAEVGGSALPLVTLGLGLTAYVAMVALDFTDPEFIRGANRKLRVASESTAPALRPESLLDPEIREVYSNIVRAFANCERTYHGVSDSLRASLDDGLRRSAELVSVAARAARRSEAIHAHLESDSPDGLEKELTRLRALAQQTQDEAARGGFLQAADEKAKELATYRQLQGLRDRVHAQLKLIEASLDGLSAKLVKLDATDIGEALSINESIAENVRNVSTDVEILESTFEETLQELRL
jgi:hypothetical protein